MARTLLFVQVEIGCDTQVKTETVLHRMKILGHICHLLAISALASLPAMLLNFPVGEYLSCHYLAQIEPLTTEQ